MSELLAELAAACHSAKATPDSEKVSAGESLWLAGRPVATDRGFIGLSMGDGYAVIVSEASIREVEKENGVYFVRVHAGTSALVRSEVITTLRGTSSDCECSERARDVVARTASGANTRTGPVIIECPLVCQVVQQCSLVLTGTGRLIRVCVPILSCRKECPTQPA